jgi:hypothetical protein
MKNRFRSTLVKTGGLSKAAYSAGERMSMRGIGAPEDA